MAALTNCLWFMGRVLRLEALVMLFYPLPTMYIAARWGLAFSDRTLFATLFLVFTTLGPMYAKFYLLNSGLLTATYARTLWWRWSFGATLLAGAAAKGLGLTLQLGWVSIILRHNAWTAVTEQVTSMVGNIFGLVNRIGGRTILGTPGASQIQVAIAIIIVFHSVYLVFLTQLSSVMLLQSVGPHQRLARTPKVPRFVKRIWERVRASRGENYR